MTRATDETTPPASVLVVGASAAGLSTVESLRRKGYAGSITVLGTERHAPYDRPPLSKQVLSGAWEPSRASLRSSEHLDSLAAEFVYGETAVSLDVATKTVRTESEQTFQADVIVIATGAAARTLPGQDGLGKVHVLRSLDDTLALRKDLGGCTRLVVVGEGVLGAEIAATARTLGIDVTITGPQPAPMALQVGSQVSSLLGQLHADHGVTLRLGTGVAELLGTAGQVSGVRLASGEVVDADVVVVAVGGIPATGWLEGSGLELDNGIVCDAWCRATDGIYAVGDVARWHDRRVDRMVRLENRTNATEQAAIVAGNILGDHHPYEPIPYFWTDQFDVKLQVYGQIPVDSKPEVVDGDIASGRFVMLYRQDGAVIGVLGWNMPKQSRLRRQNIVEDQRVRTTHATA